MGLFTDPYNTSAVPPYIMPQQRPMMVPNPPQINPMTQTRDLEKVNGIDSARQYQMPPNSRVALFDINDDIFYIRQTDASGFPTIRKFRFVEEAESIQAQPELPKYVTIDEFNKFKEEILNGQYTIQSTSANYKSNQKPGNKQSRPDDANVQGGK